MWETKLVSINFDTLWDIDQSLTIVNFQYTWWMFFNSSLIENAHGNLQIVEVLH